MFRNREVRPFSAVDRAFEGFEGDFQRPEFQDAAHPR